MKTWAIHNSLKGWTIYDLTVREMQLIVKTMSVNEVRLTQVCQREDSNWNILNDKDFPELFKFEATDSQLFPHLDSKAKEIGDTEYFVVRPKKTIHPRLHQRYETAITCMIFSTTRQFTTQTVDLSEGGLYFVDTIPDWVTGYFMVGVLAPETIYQLMCSMVEDQKERKRVQIVSEENDLHYVAYKDWLLTLIP